MQNRLIRLGLGCGLLSATLFMSGCFEITNPNEEIDAGGLQGSSITGKIFTRSNASAGTRLQALRAGLAMAAKRAESGEDNEVTTSRAPLLVPRDRTPRDLSREELRDLPRAQPPPKKANPLQWMPSEIMVLSERHAIARDAVGAEIENVVKARGLDGLIATQVVSCTAGRFCLVKLASLDGKPLDLLETERVAGELEEERKRMIARGDTRFKAISRNFLKHALATPNDEYYPFQWHYEAARIPTAWDYTVGSDTVTVAVIDSGLRTDHPDIQGRYHAGGDLITDVSLSLDNDGRDTDARDPGDLQFGEGSSWHGTHVAGTIAATTNNQQGVSGIMWQGNVLPVRVLGLQGNGTDFDILSGLFYAVGDAEVEGLPVTNTPAKILNISIGGPSTPESQQFWVDTISSLTQTEAVQYNNPIIVVAAGNEGGDVANSTPANVPGVIAVAAHDYLGRLAYYSNYGALITVIAPGGDSDQDSNQDQLPDGVLSLFETQYNFVHGTSMATPHVSGILGLLVSINPDITHSQAKEMLRTYANPEGQCASGCGAGFVDATALVIAAGGQPDQQPKLTTEETTLVFQPGELRREVVVRNTGGESLNWSGVIAGAQGDLFDLQTISGSIAPGGEQRVTIQLNRGDFEAGAANLIFSGEGEAQGQSARVELRFADEPPPPAINLRSIQVRLYQIRPDGTLQETNNVFIARSPDFEYSFDQLDAGDYQVYAYGDDNNDEVYDPQRESVGAYPLSDGPETLTVEGQTSYSKINFSLSGGFLVGAVGDVGSPCLGDSDCDFADNAACIVSPDWPQGYCTRDCADGRCNGGSCEGFDFCGDDGAPCALCLVTCVTASQCRQDEGYVCDEYGTCTPPGL